MVVTPLNVIIIVVLCIGLFWLITRGGISEPWRSMLVGAAAIGLLFVIFRLLGII